MITGSRAGNQLGVAHFAPEAATWGYGTSDSQSSRGRIAILTKEWDKKSRLHLCCCYCCCLLLSCQGFTCFQPQFRSWHLHPGFPSLGLRTPAGLLGRSLALLILHGIVGTPPTQKLPQPGLSAQGGLAPAGQLWGRLWFAGWVSRFPTRHPILPSFPRFQYKSESNNSPWPLPPTDNHFDLSEYWLLIF